MNTQLSEKLTISNVFLTFLIILLHSTWNDNRFSVLWTICDLAVPSFFCISSFLYFIKWELSWKCYIKKIIDRIKSLILPLVLFNMLAWGYYTITTSILHLWPSKFPPPVNLSGIVNYIWYSEGDAPLWFLSTLFQFALIAPIIGCIIKFSKFSVLLVVLCGFVTHSVSYTSLLFWLPCFMLGAWCAIWYPIVEEKVRYLGLHIHTGVLPLISIITIFIFSVIFISISDRSHDNLYYLYRMLAPILLSLILIDYNIIPVNIAKLLSIFTMYAYGTHFLIIELLKVAIRFISIDSFIIRFLFIVIFTLLFIYITGAFLRKKIRYMWYWLNGCRAK